MGNLFSAGKGAQGKATTWVQGWLGTTNRFRSIAFLVFFIVLAYVIVFGVFLGRKKFFHLWEPSRKELERARIIDDLKAFDKLHFPHNAERFS
jgi:hypothetical protein